MDNQNIEGVDLDKRPLIDRSNEALEYCIKALESFGISENGRKFALQNAREVISAIARRAEPSVTAGVSEDVLRFGIQVEKMLCAALGREWSTSGISIESLIAELQPLASPAVSQKTSKEFRIDLKAGIVAFDGDEWTFPPTAAGMRDWLREYFANGVPAVSQMDGAAAEPVGEIVAGDAAHGWHMKALKPWDEIGEGTLLYAGSPSTAATTESTDHSEDVRDMVDWKANAECLLEEVKQYREIFKAAAMGEATTASAATDEPDIYDAVRDFRNRNQSRATAPSRDAAQELPYVEGWSLPRDLPTAHAEIQKLRIAYAEALAQKGASQAPMTDEQYQEVLRPVLSRYGMQRYLNGDSITLDPSDYRAIIDRAALARAPLPAQGAPVALCDALRRSGVNRDYHGLIAFTPAQLDHFYSMVAAPAQAGDAREDSERLNYIESGHLALDPCEDQDGIRCYEVNEILGDKEDDSKRTLGFGLTPRAAIDAARTAYQDKGGAA